MAETNAQRKKRRIIPNTLAEAEQVQPITEQATFGVGGAGGPSQFGRGLASGFKQVESIGQNVLGIGGAAVGADEFAERRILAGQQAAEEAAEAGPRITRIEDIRGFEDVVDYVAGVAGQQLPILGTAVLGGIGGVAARSRLPAAAQSAISKPVAAAVGTVGTGIGLEAGSIFGDIANDPESRKNLSLRQIAGTSVAFAVPAGGLEALPIISMFRRVGLGKSATRAIRSSLAKRVGKGAGSQALLEGATEGAQTVIERAAAKFANENREILGEEGFSEIINAIAAGGIVGGGLGGLAGGFQPGSVEDQLDIEESLDELETTGGSSSQIDTDLGELGNLGLDIREARNLASDIELEVEPERVVERLLRTAMEEGQLPTFRAFDQLKKAIANLENPAQLENIMIAAGVSDNLRPELRDALLGEVNEDREDYISLAVDERPDALITETGPEEHGGPGGFQAPNVTRGHILRNKKGELGFVVARNPTMVNGLRTNLENLENDFPDINFGIVGLGDALKASLPEAAKKDPRKALQILNNFAVEKMNEQSFKPEKQAALDPSDPVTFLNQWGTIEKEEVNLTLTGRDEFRLTNSDITGGLKTGTIQLGGPVTSVAATPRIQELSKEERTLRRELRTTDLPTGQRTVKQANLDKVVAEKAELLQKSLRVREGKAKATARQGRARAIFVARVASKDGDFTVDAKGKDQTVDAIAVTNMMLTKKRLDKSPNTSEIGDAFFTGLSALIQRGVIFDPAELSDNLIIHKKKGANGRAITYGEVRKSGSGRIRARIMALKHQQVRLDAQVKDIAKNLSNAGPKAQSGMKQLQRKLRRRIKKIPTEIETLNIYGQSISKDVQSLTERLNDASELASAMAAEGEALGDLALDIQDIRRHLQQEGTNTQAAEELSTIGKKLEELDDFASETRRTRRQTTAPAGSKEAGEGERLTLEEFAQAKFENQQELIARFGSDAPKFSTEFLEALANIDPEKGLTKAQLEKRAQLKAELDRLREKDEFARKLGERRVAQTREDFINPPPSKDARIFSALFSRDGGGLTEIAGKQDEVRKNMRSIEQRLLKFVEEKLPRGVELDQESGQDNTPFIVNPEAAPKSFVRKFNRIRERMKELEKELAGAKNEVIASIDPVTQAFVETEFDKLAKKLRITGAKIVVGDDIPHILGLLGGEETMDNFLDGSGGGVTFARVRTIEHMMQILTRGKDVFQEDGKDISDKDLLELAETLLKKHDEAFGDKSITHIVMVNPFINNRALAAEIMAHEIGHVIFQTRYQEASSEVQSAMVGEFGRWRRQVGAADVTLDAAFASKRAFEFALEGMGMARDVRVSDLKKDSKTLNYLFSFEEWFADQTSRWFVDPPAEAETIAMNWFKGVAFEIRKLWDTFVAQFGFEPARSVKNFLDDIVEKDADQRLKEAHEMMMEEFGHTMARVFKDEDITSDNKAIASVFQTIDPFGDNTNYSIRKVMLDNLEPEERKLVFKYFNRRSTKKRLKELLTDPKQQQMIDGSPLHAAVYGYQMWIAGDFKLQDTLQDTIDEAGAVIGEPKLIALVGRIFRSLFDSIAFRLGFVYESEQAGQILEAIRDNTITARKAGTGQFSVVKAVRETVLERIGQTSNDAFLHIKPFFDKALGVADARMLDSGIPAFVEIAKMFHAQTGSENQPETFFEARRTQIGKFMNHYTRITTALRDNEELKTEVHGLLRNPKKRGSAEAIAHASEIRRLLRRIRNYIEKSGVLIGDRGKDYFPWVFDTRKIQDNSDFIRGLLEDKRFAPNMQGILNNINKAIHEKNIEKKNRGGAAKFEKPRPPITMEDLVERMMMGLQQSEGLADTNLNPDRAGTVPFFAAMNKRTLAFLVKEKNGLTAAEREKFDSLFSDQLDLTMMTYIRQAVKRTEYTKRAGVQSENLTELLRKAIEEGASDQDFTMAYNYIDAMTGVIGEDTNNRISKTLGLGKNEGEVINPHFRTFTSIAMVLQNLAVLPLATFTSLVDPVGILVRSQDMRATMAALRAGAQEIIAEVRILAGGDEKKIRTELRKLAEGLGTIEDHMTNEALEWEYGSTYLTPRLKAANEFFFKAIGLTQWTRVTRLMALAGGKEFIKRHVLRQNENSERFLKQLNLDANDVKFDKDGDIVILSRLQREEGRIDTAELERDDRVRNALNRFVDESILRPNAAQRPIWASDPNYALIFHLKSFMFSFHDRILRRASQEAELGNTMPLMLLAVFIPAMLMADILRDLIQFGTGGNPRKANWGLNDHIWSATQRSGLNGIGQLLIDGQQDVQFGGLGYESLAGPTVDGITDLGGLFSSDDEAQWNAFTRNLPGSTVWKHWLENGFDES